MVGWRTIRPNTSLLSPIYTSRHLERLQIGHGSQCTSLLPRGGQGGRTWGTHFLDTKAVASMLCRPVCDSLNRHHNVCTVVSERRGEWTTLTSREDLLGAARQRGYPWYTPQLGTSV